MEDFLVLSILDLRLDAQQHKAVDKSEVIVSVMLGETCIDLLVLGSPNASLQDQAKLNRILGSNGESGGQADQNQRDSADAEEERGSCHKENSKVRAQATANLAKKTKIPLAGLRQGHSQTPPTFQIVVKRVGSEKERYGSVSFSLKRFQRAAAQSYIHWVTLYDSLDDDLFEGQLGIDDDFDYPKVLLEYSIVSSQFTSMVNAADNLIGKVANEQARR